MYKWAFMYNYYVYRLYDSIYIYMYVLAYMYGDSSMHIYVDTSKLIDITLLFIFS